MHFFKIYSGSTTFLEVNIRGAAFLTNSFFMSQALESTSKTSLCRSTPSKFSNENLKDEKKTKKTIHIDIVLPIHSS